MSTQKIATIIDVSFIISVILGFVWLRFIVSGWIILGVLLTLLALRVLLAFKK